ncbi:hypothetical protein ASPZODRAFT_284508 [Penicilliopsis zonata CBS 506.65]|uniref:GP-PDE domain-containing protein n=1 Tax=Penicilliopsis zonata CBS 506.65 TaxID=1073090 RepID=A0A1L9SV10_9EURO|nr:hypothetical protein ASPZODRAFT_284508 [Penicilliopsis zonata CBS 506.65]OJJ50907.1 hypothetical protein ASPZODRAFT_284508 [Penicilliopsis zonata CBS 506.65]
MKFGHNLPRNVVPEWSTSYIKYKALKKLIKLAAGDVKAGHEPDLAGFFYALDRNVEDVDHFYNKKLADFTRRYKLLEDRYGVTMQAGERLEIEDAKDLFNALVELRGQMRNLQYYAEVNRRGFVKITKKLDKKVGTNAQKRYLETKVDPTPFASSTGVFDTIKRLSDWISSVGDPDAADETASVRSTRSLTKGGAGRPNLNLPESLLVAVDRALQTDDVHVLLELLEEVRAALGTTTTTTTTAAADAITDDDQQQTAARSFQQALRSLLQRAISRRALACIPVLLAPIENDLQEEDDINKRNCIHRLVISIGRSQTTTDSEPSAEPGLINLSGSSTTATAAETANYIIPAAPPTLLPPRPILQESHQPKLLSREDPAVALLQHLLDQLRPHQRTALLAKDISNRTPLHYAAQYGFRIVCEIVIQHLQAWGLFDVSGGIDGPAWQDSEGWAPLHLAVVGGHPLTTQALLEAEHWHDPTTKDQVTIRHDISKSSVVLALAIKANFVDIVQLLVDAGVDVNYQDEQGETALHIAARFARDRCARILLHGSAAQRADPELAEHTYSWTPLFTACVDGSLGVVNLLIEFGADLTRPDSSGWTAKEHAALRGHLDIARRLAEVTPEPEAADPEQVIPVPLPPSAVSPTTTTTTTTAAAAAATALASSPASQSSLIERRSTTSASNASSGGAGAPRTEPIKTFGHRYLTDETMILVSLGTMDMRKPTETVNLDRIPFASAHSTQLDTALSLVVSASGAHGEPEVIDLPIHENICTEPIVFHAADASKVRLLFDLVPTYAGSRDKIVGRGVALLSSVKPSVGSHRINLKGDSTVAVVAANTLEVIGSVTFNFLIITPFHHPNLSITSDHTYWRRMSDTMVIGHRGLGKNIASRKSLQLGENTVQSFIAAANLGASYVEFDVQLTKDHVPVIYHDFLVSETGIDAPVHTLTLEQFLQLGDHRAWKGLRAGSPPRLQTTSSAFPDVATPTTSTSAGGGSIAAQRQRAMSVGGSEYDPSELNERIKHTRDFKKKGFKGNSRGNHIQAPFATLEELFQKLPKSVGFNIEMKYPMLHESEEEEMDTYAVELNSFVDTVLKMVYTLGSDRNMIFSSFNPDICLLLAFKQPSIPVLFLTDSGASPVGDIRASSLQEAIRFASRWNLLGIVSQAEPLVLCPRLVRVVKESGLVCVSYGAMNNEPSNVKLQVAEGIDAVIVDSVLAIRKGLTESGSKGITPAVSPRPGPISSQEEARLKETMNIPVLDTAVRTDHLHINPALG